jgi:tetratricopeptide (TPR) repeat protein
MLASISTKTIAAGNRLGALFCACLIFSSVQFSQFCIAQTESKSEQEPPDSTDDDEQQKKPAESQTGDESKPSQNQDENDGQADLDEAFEMKIAVTSTRELDKIADLCESALNKGLDDESKEQAIELWATVLYDHAVELDRRIAPQGIPSTRWRWLRQQAISRLEKAVELRPAKIDALILLARLHSMQAGNRDAALEAIEKAIAQISGDNQKLSKALQVRARLAEDEQARIADLTQAVKIDPQNQEALMERALFFLGNEQPAEAMDDFRRLLTDDQDNVDRHIIISEQLRQTGHYAQSVEILDLAIENHEQNGELYFLRGRAHLANDNNEAALADLNKALEINHQNLDALNLRSRVYLVKEDYEQALRDANELIQQAPDKSVGLELRSLVYRAQRQFDKSIEDLKSLLKREPNNLDLQFDLAMLYSADEQPSKAIPILNTVLARTDSLRPEILRQRGDAYLSLGKHEEAIDDYESALEIIDAEFESTDDKDLPERQKDSQSGLINNLAWVLATSPEDRLRDGKRALELALRASEFSDYKAAYILSTLASAYAENGDFDSARKWASKAVELAESDEQRVGLQEELDSYLQDKPWRELENVEDKNKDKVDSKDESNSDDKSTGDEKTGNSNGQADQLPKSDEPDKSDEADKSGEADKTNKTKVNS